MTGFDYTSTARRPGDETLPREIRDVIAGLLGGGPDDVRPAGGGFTPGFAAVVRRADRVIFVKAASSDDPIALPVENLLRTSPLSTDADPDAVDA